MPQRNKPKRRALALMLLLMLCAGCASAPQRTVVVPAPVLPLPQEARQPPTPGICQPTCSEGLGKLLDNLLPSPTPAASPARPASASQGAQTHRQ